MVSVSRQGQIWFKFCLSGNKMDSLSSNIPDLPQRQCPVSHQTGRTGFKDTWGSTNWNCEHVFLTVSRGSVQVFICERFSAAWRESPHLIPAYKDSGQRSLSHGGRITLKNTLNTSALSLQHLLCELILKAGEHAAIQHCRSSQVAFKTPVNVPVSTFRARLALWCRRDLWPQWVRT